LVEFLGLEEAGFTHGLGGDLQSVEDLSGVASVYLLEAEGPNEGGEGGLDGVNVLKVGKVEVVEDLGGGTVKLAGDGGVALGTVLESLTQAGEVGDGFLVVGAEVSVSLGEPATGGSGSKDESASSGNLGHGSVSSCQFSVVS
jgi:hypothetical protein